MDLRHATHQEAVQWLVQQRGDIELIVRHVPPPLGLKVGVVLCVGISYCYELKWRCDVYTMSSQLLILGILSYSVDALLNSVLQLNWFIFLGN